MGSNQPRKEGEPDQDWLQLGVCWNRKESVPQRAARNVFRQQGLQITLSRHYNTEQFCYPPKQSSGWNVEVKVNAKLGREIGGVEALERRWRTGWFTLYGKVEFLSSPDGGFSSTSDSMGNDQPFSLHCKRTKSASSARGRRGEKNLVFQTLHLNEAFT